MEYAQFGQTGTKVSRICLGCWTYGNEEDWMLEKEDARPIIERALDLGINFFDTANVYSRGRSEEIIGDLLKNRRDDMIIATKVYAEIGDGPNDRGLSRKHISQQIERSLKRLQTDYIDLYQTHRWDFETPIEETLVTFNSLVKQGKIRYFGASSMSAWQFAKALWTSDRLGIDRFQSMQNLYNLAYREEEREMIPLCLDQHISLIPWSPLAGGRLSGKYTRKGEPESRRARRNKNNAVDRDRWDRPETFNVLERVQEVAKEKDVTPSQISLAWLFHKNVTSPIIGATKVKHVDDSVASLDIQLSTDDLARLEEPYIAQDIIGHDWKRPNVN